MNGHWHVAAALGIRFQSGGFSVRARLYSDKLSIFLRLLIIYVMKICTRFSYRFVGLPSMRREFPL